MKYFNKPKVFFLFVLFSYGVDTFAYTFRIANETGRDVKVLLKYAFGRLNDYPNLIRAGAKRTFSFGEWESGRTLMMQ